MPANRFLLPRVNNPGRMIAELVWEGEYDEFGDRLEVNAASLAIPLQKIETIDEPRHTPTVNRLIMGAILSGFSVSSA